MSMGGGAMAALAGSLWCSTTLKPALHRTSTATGAITVSALMEKAALALPWLHAVLSRWDGCCHVSAAIGFP